jgi:hypothetical protein
MHTLPLKLSTESLFASNIWHLSMLRSDTRLTGSQRQYIESLWAGKNLITLSPRPTHLVYLDVKWCLCRTQHMLLYSFVFGRPKLIICVRRVNATAAPFVPTFDWCHRSRSPFPLNAVQSSGVLFANKFRSESLLSLPTHSPFTSSCRQLILFLLDSLQGRAAVVFL